MKLLKGTKIALKTLGAHKMRTALAVIGIVIGVSAVVLMVAIGRGAQEAVLKKIQGLGTNLIIVTAGKVRIIAGRPRQTGNITSLTVRDAEALADESSAIGGAAPLQGKKYLVKYGEASTNTVVSGTTSKFSGIRNFRPAMGRFFTEDEVKASMRVAVLGRTIVRNLFEDRAVIGEMIRINNVPFEVIGVLEEKGVNAIGQDDDDQILIPITTVMRRLMNVIYVNNVYIAARDVSLMDKAVADITSILRERHHLKPGKEDDFSIQNQMDILRAEQETSETFTMLLGGIAAVSLLVGGVGILAIMLISIKERVKEIGLRRAVGARRKDILLQFLIEALVLSVAGGLIGIVFGVSGSFVVGWTTELPTSVSALSIIVAFLFSAAVGLFFGIYPARKAAELDPIYALRSE
ncbi:MAG TPA: ABC transporter permease [Nitrospirota bacterium]|nr:ABC transporter permease [Nitrospirota bacterium]